MRSSFPFLAFLLALVPGCGGRTDAILGIDGGGGSSGGGSSGASSGSSSGVSSGGFGSSSGTSSGASSGGFGSSSGASSGASSGFGSSSGFSSGASSGGFGSSSGFSSGGSSGFGSSSGFSSGGSLCEPLPGCDSSTQCQEPDGCGVCFCEDGAWTCGSDVDAGLSCPIGPPLSGSFCSSCGAFSCGYGSPDGCGETCDCAGGTWECFAQPCLPPPPTEICPEFPPSSGTACFGVGSSCFYDLDGACSALQCVCGPFGTFDCYNPVVCAVDGGGFESGTSVDGGGPFDGGNEVCPGQLPASSSPCLSDGLVCTYFASCQTNCLCAGDAWVCATEAPCTVGDE